MFDGLNPLQESDPLFNKSTFNGNLVLCRLLKDKKKKIMVNYKGSLEEKIRNVYSKINIELSFTNSNSKKEKLFGQPPNFIEVNLNSSPCNEHLNYIENQNYAFLGILPSTQAGLSTIGFMLRDKKYSKPNIKKVELSDKERKDFILKILADLSPSSL